MPRDGRFPDFIITNKSDCMVIVSDNYGGLLVFGPDDELDHIFMEIKDGAHNAWLGLTHQDALDLIDALHRAIIATRTGG